MPSPLDLLDRRRFLRLALALPAAFAAMMRLRRIGVADAAEALLAAGGPGLRRDGSTRALAATPDCDDDAPTPAETAGPFFTPHSPRRTTLREPGMPGTPIVLTGRVYGTSCRPVAGALVDFWHADDSGEYDTVGFRLRGHQFTDGNGNYRLATIVPGLYPGRTRHFHVKVQAPHGRVLTTQLYFPREPRNDEDGLYRADLLMAVRETGAVHAARFDFVLHAG